MTPVGSALRSESDATPSSRPLDLRVFENPLDLAEQLSDDICHQIIDRLKVSPRLVLTASGGRSFSLTYRLLRERHAHRLDWKRVVTVQMDEYLGLGRGDARSLAHQLDRELVRPLGIDTFVTFFDEEGARAHDPSSCDRLVASLGGLDLALHGIGVNGHVGFNEPGSSPKSVTRIVDLAEETRRANFTDIALAPKRAVTLGLATLGKALNVIVHDHLIIGRQGHASFRSLQLL